jgi:long-chain acyl-CoA synthetase
MVDRAQDTSPKLLLGNAEKWPGTVAMRKKRFGIWKEYTWEDCLQKVKDFSLGLVHLGLRKGEPIAILGGKEPEWLWAEFGAQAAGAVTLGMYADLELSQIKAIAQHCPFKFAVAGDQEQVDKFLEIQEDHPSLQQIIYWDPRGLTTYSSDRLKSFVEVMNLGKAYDSASPGVFEKNVSAGKGDDCAAIYYTSGTTGMAKPAMLSHRALISSGEAFLEFNPTGHKENYFSDLPGAWIGEGILVTAAHLLRGVILNFAEGPETLQEDLREIGPEVVFYKPRQWEDLARIVQLKMRGTRGIKSRLYRNFLKRAYKQVERTGLDGLPGRFQEFLHALGDRIIFHPLRENFGLKKCKAGITTGSPISIDGFKFWKALGVRLKQAYVSTEAGFIAGHASSGEIHPDTMGQVNSRATVKIADTGEIVVKSPTLFSGYYGSPEKEQEILTSEWVHTGDAGFFNSEGELVFLDLLTDIGRKGEGPRFVPQLIEGRLRFSPYIKDAMVLGEQDWDFRTAIIILDFENLSKWAEDQKIKYMTLAELSEKEEVAGLIRGEIQRLGRRTAGEARIRKFVLLPREFQVHEGELTRMGKLRRRLVRERYAELIHALRSKVGRIRVKWAGESTGGKDTRMETELHIWSVDEGPND